MPRDVYLTLIKVVSAQLAGTKDDAYSEDLVSALDWLIDHAPVEEA